MRGVFSAKFTILLKFQPLSGGLFIFCIRIIFSITILACEMNDHSHNVQQPLFKCDPPPGIWLALIKKKTRFSLVSKENPKPTIGIEPMTSSLPRKCSTTELRGRKKLIRLTKKVERETGLEPATLSLEG